VPTAGYIASRVSESITDGNVKKIIINKLICRRLVETTGDVRASSFLFQRISVVVHRFNSVLLHDGFIDDDRLEQGSLPNKFCNLLL